MNTRASERVPAVWVNVLGPLQLVVADEIVEVPGPKRRTLLALLAMADSRAVPVVDLLDALWPTALPDSARATLHSHISRLRRHLGPAAARLEGRTGAYRLRLDDGGCGTDDARARSLLAAAGSAEPSDAMGLLDDAHSLWRGEPLAELADVAPLAAWAVTLRELRRTVDEAHATAALDAGATGEAVERATALVAATPLSEPAVVLLMRALHAAGRSAEALRAGYDHRRRLAAETGLDPSPGLAHLEREIAGTTRRHPGGVARPAGRLRGRDAELGALHRLVADERLVTVVGPGGVGKTRLATEVAARAEQATALWLAPVSDPAALPHVLATALELRVGHPDVLPACAALLAAGPHLLLVDNCEHILADVSGLVATLLDACPQLTILATSREPFGLDAEQRLRLAPLPLAPPPDLDGVARSPAVALFVDRARRVRPGFAPEGDDAGRIADIVHRLDGLPLAIELAAGRLSSLSLADLHARLDRSLDLLGDGRDVTLRRTFAWSYDLLTSHERTLLRHLSVYPDGFDLMTAEAVAADLGVPTDAAGALAHLVDASMIEATLDGEPRYRMLATMRSFARDQLRSTGEEEAAVERFLQWTRDLVAWLHRTIPTDEEARADRLVRRELANLRAAWRLVRSRGRLDDAVRIVVGLSDAAGWRGLAEVWAWTLELADDPRIAAHPEAPTVFGTAAGSAWARGELDRAEQLARRGLALGSDEPWNCQAALALVALTRGDHAGAVTSGLRAAAHATGADPSLGIAALAAAYQGELEQATTLNARMAGIPAGPTLESFHHYVAGEIDNLAGRVNRAEEHYERAVTLARASGATFVQGIAWVGLATVRAATGRVAAALDGYRHLIDYWERTGGWAQEWTTLRNLARLLRELGDEEAAVFLESAADNAPDAPTVTGTVEANRPMLPSGLMDEIRARAAASSRARVLDVARRAIDRHRTSPRDAHGLTPSA